MKILIAEDDDVSRLLLERTLGMMGHDLISTTNGLEALKVYKENDFDMAILDWMMPEMDGIELCMKIRELEEGADTPLFIFMVTAKSSADDMLHALEAGVDDFLTKPVDKKALERRIERGLLYQRLVKSENRSKQTPYLILKEEHDVFRSLIHIFDVILEELEHGISEDTMRWPISTLETLISNIHHGKEEQYFRSFIKSITAEHVFWFSDVSESSFTTIANEHQEIEADIITLKDAVFDTLFDVTTEISSLKESIKQLTGLMLRHMYKEEKYYFPFAQKYLAEDEQAELLVKFEQIDSLIGKQNIDRKINDITQLLKLLTENEENIKTWRPSD